MRRYQLAGLAVAFALLGLLACDVLQDKEFEPTGTTFNLNGNIRVVSITGDPHVPPPEAQGPIGLGMTISSRTSSIETDELPAGLFLKRRKNDTQHMIILKPRVITTGATGNTTVLLGTYCCNKGIPSPDEGDTFDIGPITDNEDLLQIAELVRNKDISGYTDQFVVQRAVNMVTDSTGLTQAYIDSLDALPDETGLARR